MTVDIHRPPPGARDPFRPPEVESVVDLLRLRARLQGDRPAYTFLTDGEAEGGRLTFAELDRRAREVGAKLQGLGASGRTVLLLYPPGLEFVAGFLGCLYAGAVAVPAYPPRSRRSLPRLVSIARDARPAAALTTGELAARLEGLSAGVPELGDLPSIATDVLDPGTAAGWSHPGADRNTLAFLQYTSGSTAEPKGVMVTHGNLLANEETIRRAFGQDERSVIVGWLPLYHDMGLIGNVLQPLYLGARCILMSPVAFLQRPFRWVQAVSRYRATTSGGPNFAYELAARKLRREDVETLAEPFDLASWSVAFNGAEPVRAETLDRFAETFGPYGFRREAFYPCYGLAEATLFVTGGDATGEPVTSGFDPVALERGRAIPSGDPGGRILVGCGRPWGDHEIVVVDTDACRPCPPGVVGEIWVRGPSVAGGYWGRPEASERDFAARLAGPAEAGGEGPFLRTGDLGFVEGGELFVTGRQKDLIILRGRNLYPQDVESTAERAHAALRPGCAAAFAIDGDGGEGLVVVVEVHRRHHGTDPDAVADAVRRAVAEEHDARVDTVVLIRHGTILKTSSGKIRRRACRAALLAGELAELGRYGPPGSEGERGETGAAFPSRDELLGVAPAERRALLAAALRDELARGLGVAAARIDPGEPVLLDSLAALELKTRVDAALALDLPLAGLLDGPTPEGLAALVVAGLVAPPGEGPGLPAVRRASGPAEMGPLSHGQRALWVEHRLAPESPAYTVAFAARIVPGERAIDPRLLRRALATLVERHQVLGVVVEERDEGPVQIYRAGDGEPRLDYQEIDARTWDGSGLRDRLDAELHRPFDLQAAPPLRARVFVRRDGPVLLLACHHLAIDLHSLVVLLGELGVVHRALAAGEGSGLEAPALRHADYVAWQTRWLAGAKGEEHWRWWRERLAGAPSALDLPTDRPRPSARRLRGGAVAVDLPPAAVEGLAALARRDGGTLFMALASAFAVLLARHAGAERVVIGSPAAGRPRPELRGLVGYLVNPLPLPIDLAGDPTFSELHARVRGTVLGALAHEGYPLALLAERLAEAGERAGGETAGQGGLFRSLLVLERPRPAAAGAVLGDRAVVAPFVLGRAGGRITLGDLELESVPFVLRGAQVDLALALVDEGPGAPLAGELRYDADLFDRATAERLARRFGVLVAALIADPLRPVAALPQLTVSEEHQVRHEWNDAERRYAEASSVDELIARSVTEAPERVAIVSGETHLSYAGFARRVRNLAARLRDLGVGPEVRVGVCAERSADLVVALAAVLEAGGAYVPLDPSYPPDRLAYMVADAGVALLVVERRLAAELPAMVVAAPRTLALEDAVAGAPADSRAEPPAPQARPDRLAYVIYTSGSTGRPKGAMNAHAAVANRLLWMRDAYAVGPGDRVLQKTPFSFDVSVWELFLPLVAGARLVMARPGGHQDPAYLLDAVRRHGITLTHFVPSMLQLFVEAADREPDGGPACPSLTRVIASGEALPGELRDRFRARFAGALHNLYGPTEAAVDVTAWATAADPPGRPAPIGRPVANTAIHLLDRACRPVPPGVPGELHIGGVQVGRGYLGRPAQTADRFRPDPFGGTSGTTAGARLYATGDLARHRPDGAIDFLGRIDHQVKVRGLRIELGEIEAALESHPSVREVVVVALEVAGDTRLVAYLVPSAGADLDAGGLRAHLARSLPEYMVPAAFEVLGELPLTPSGKVDRRALPAPRRQDGGADAPPRTGTEQVVAALWCELLGRDRVGRDDHFFRAGGHSLLAARLATRIERDLGVPLPLRVAFERPTVAALAEWIDAEGRRATAASPDGPALVPVPRPVPGEPGLPLSFAQERLWFLEQMDPGRPVYTMAGGARVAGRLDSRCLADALASLVERHEALRTVFPLDGAEPVQEVRAPAPVALPVVDLSGLDPDLRAAAAEALGAAVARRPFDLAAGPLLRTALLRLSGAEHRVFVTMHHIVSDGWSVAVFLRELAALYAGAVSGVPVDLPPLPVQYADYAVWQRRRLAGDRLEARLDWWRARLAGAPTLLDVPADHPRPPRPSQRGATARLRRGGELARALSRVAEHHDATSFAVLLAALDALLFRYTEQTDLVVGCPVANRDRVEIEGLIGFFVNTVPHRSDLSGRPSFAELLGRVQSGVLDTLGHQDVPFVKLVEALDPVRDPSHPPVFQVMLAVEPAWAPVELPGLVLEPFLPDAGVAKFDLTFQVREGRDSVDLALEANLDLFERATAERMLRHFAVLLDGALAAPDRRLSDLPLLSAAERLQMLDEWNAEGPGAHFPAELLHHAVARRAAETPDAVAVVFGGEGRARRPVVWTYRELVGRADRLARRLAGMGVGQEVLVGVSVERSPELVLAVLAVLRAGGAWLPLDPAYPRERLQGMMDDAAPRVLLTQTRLLSALPATGAEIVVLDGGEAPRDEPPAGPLDPPLEPENLAYVIYTSGSTGRPKGVALSHRGLANLCLAQAATFGPGPGDRVLQFAPASFDASVFELAMALASGAEIHLADPDGLLPGAPLARLLRDRRITIATMPPSALATLPSPEGADLPALATVIVAGEACPPELARSWGAGRRRRFFNAYGPTETTVWATTEPCADPDAAVTIGRPIVNARVHLLDARGVPIPVGVPGELHVGGPGVARGYLRRPALTAERFVPDPEGGRRGAPGERLYRTGDLARYLPDGRIDFLGRSDHQVKVRGFRIELGEIEAVLTSHPEVAEAVVLPRDGGPSGPLLVGLVGYVLARGDAPEEVLRRELTARLSARLPGYMVPSALRVLGEFPRTPAGKVDRRALAAQGALTAAGAGEADAPRGPLEARLAALWEALLALPPGAVSRDASFFDLGGHSLLATRVTARVREELGVELPVRRVFERPTLAGLAAELERLGAGTATGTAAGSAVVPPLLPAERLEGHRWEPPLSFAQERLWFLDRLQPGDPSYNVPTAVRLRGRLVPTALAAALNRVVARHEALRTTFARRPSGPIQVIAPELRVPVPVADLGGLGGDQRARRESELRKLARAEARRPFDLAAGPLVRATLVRLGPEESVLLLSLHHAVSDGWSVGVLLRELGTLYGAALAGREPALPPLAVQYGDVAIWQRGWLSGELLERQLGYWRGALAGLPELLELPTDRPRPPVWSTAGGTVPLDLGAELTGAVDRLAGQHGATPFMVLLAAYQALLGRWAGQLDLAVGTPVANRTHAATEDLIGFFVNTLVLRGDLGGDPSFAELLDRVRATALAAYAHQDLPFEKLVEDLRPERSLAHTPLFQVMLVLQNAPIGPLELPGLTLEPLPEEQPAAKFDLTLTLVEAGARRTGRLDYRLDLFERATAERFVGHFATLLADAVARPSARSSELAWLTEAERRQLAAWNRTGREYPREAALHELILAQAETTPERIAVVAGGRHLSYGALAGRSAALAARLRALGVGPEVRVGVAAERSLELVVALLSVLRAGGAYVPLDPSYPADRLAYMVEDAALRALLAQRHVVETIPALARTAADLVLLDGGAAEPPPGRPPEEGAPRPGATALAYAIYTSGSTGRPKGAMNAHAGIVNRLLWMRDEYSVGEADRILQKTPFSFDVSVWELFLPLLAGARLVMAAPDGHKDPAYLVDVVRRERITMTHFVPSMLQAFVAAPGLESCDSLRRVIASGEALPGDLRDRLRERLRVELHNLYGPTEAAVDVTAWDCSSDRPGSAVPIGRPVANTAVHLVDPWFRAVSVGVAGELLIGGIQVGRGYLGRPALTAERFVPDPFDGQAGARVYRTGDLARFRGDGAVEFLGRLDHQVKVRGFRIELGEVEAALEAHPAVREAVVVAIPGEGGRAGEGRLAAYLVSAGAPPPDAADLRADLLRSLPDYMVPSAFVVLAELPLTPSGKVDRRALPAPAWGAVDAGRPAAAPRTATEELLAELWGDVLGRETIGVDDDFFALGGHSLLGARVMARVAEATGVDLPLVRLFETPTVAGLARALEEGSAGPEATVAAPPLRPVPRDGTVPLALSPAQERLWFLDKLYPKSPWYNLPAALRLRGDLDAPELARALATVVRRHEALRTVIGGSDEAPVQVVRPAAPRYELPVVDLRGLAPGPGREGLARALAAGEARRPFDLAEGPLVRASLVRLGDRDHVLLLTLHHIVADGWSLGVFLRELAAAYRADRGAPPLPEPPVQYGDYAAWQRARLADGLEERQLRFWRGRLAGAPPVLELPADRPRPARQSLAGGRVAISLRGDVETDLRRLGRRRGATLFMTLLAIFDAWLARHGAGRDLVVGSAVAGRDRTELEGLIGLFVNLLPLRVELPADPGLEEILAAARGAVLAAHAHRDVPFEKLVAELRPSRDTSHAPLVQAVLLLEEAPPAPELRGLAVEALELDSGTAKFDLNLSFRPGGGGLAGVLEYNRDLFDATTAARLARRFERLAAGYAASMRDGGRFVRLSELPLLSPAERHQVAVEWCAPAGRRPPEISLAELFAAVVREYPDRVAVADADGTTQVTYGELARRSRRLAGRLASLGVGPDSRVGLALERSPRLVEAILAILEAGGAYVPLDPGYPGERLRFMIADAGVEVLVTDRVVRAELPVDGFEARGAVLVLDGAGSATVGPPPSLAPAEPDRLAYVMYTSGSTGRPKGVAVPQRAVVRLVHETGYARFGPDETFLHLAPVSFDASTLELWGALLHGGRLVVVADRAPTLAAIASTLSRHRVTSLWLTAGLYHQMVEERVEALAPVRQLLAGGDVLSPAAVRATLERLAGTVVINGYGPTENTTFTCCHPMAGPGAAADPVPIGRPIAGTRVYLLDRSMRPVALGVAGELFAGGSGLARGYQGRPALTAERFVPDPLAGGAGAVGGRLYRTGDRARHLAGGAIEFLGRLDHQVKVRGFRIELGEIEVALRAHPAVAQAAVVVHESAPGGKLLVACLAAAAGHDLPAPAELRGHLRERLPEFMVPAHFLALPELPLDPNGKVDRRVLRELGAHRLAETASAAGALAPRTPTEEALAAIWREVLGLDRVGVDDDFFDLGGHSLLATRLGARVRSALGVDLPLRTLFERPTIAALAAWIEERAAIPPEAPDLVPVPRTGRLPLSFSQQRLWFLDRFAPGSALYDIAAAFRCRGSLVPARLARALSRVVGRHEALRTRFVEVAGEPFQVIAEPRAVPLPVVDLEALPALRRAAVAERLAAAEAARPFDLERGPLVRAFLVRLGALDHLFVVNQHHIVSDGWSVGVMVRELAAAYGGGAAPPPLEIQFADYAAWERTWLTGQALERRLDYWRRALAGVPALELPTDRPRPAHQTFRGAARTARLGAELSEQLHELARREGATLFMVLLAGFDVLLARGSGQYDFAVGTPVAGRGRRELEPLIGFFVNTLALRADLSGAPSFAELVRRTRVRTLEALAHQELPFERVVEELAPERDLARSPIFQVAFALQEAPPVPALAGIEVEPLAVGQRVARFDLGLAAVETAAGVETSLAFNVDLFDPTRAERMLAHYRQLLAAAVAEPEVPVTLLPLLTPAERHQLTGEWNDPGRGLPIGNDPAGAAAPEDLVAARAAECPEAIALAARGEAWSYGALDRRVAALARELRAVGVGPETVAGVSIERSFGMVAGLLAVLRAGGAYLPLDPSYPADRLRFMMADAGISLVLTDRRGASALPAPRSAVHRLLVEDLLAAADARARPDGTRWPPTEGTGPGLLDAAAYVIYTSGSTGEPKGVVGTRRAIGNLLADRLRSTVGRDDRVLQKTPVSFDASIFELFSPLVAGATMVLARPNGEQDAAYVVRLIAEERITVAGSTPSMLATILEQPGIEGCRTLRRMATGSEAVPVELAQRYQALGLSDLFNLYGPTETTVAVLEWRSRLGCDDRTLPIGRPIAGARVHLVDAAGEPVPVGVPGELVVGGPPLARGYLGRPAATAERYVPDPFVGPACAGARVYRTGDLARRRPDGAIEFVGRIDRQVKIRGFRVELEEVERALLDVPGVREAVVLAQESGAEATRRLVAFLVAAEGAPGDGPGAGALRERLGERLPGFMIPSAFVLLEELPLTPSGKVDRRALAEIDPGAAAAPLARSAGYVAPRDGVEHALAGIWSDLLGVDEVGVRDDFFELGGHSLLAVRLLARVAAATGRELPLASLFEASTVETMAARLRGSELTGGAATCLVPLAPGGDRPPLFLVHAIGGSVFAYRELAGILGRGGRPVFGLQARGLTPEAEPHPSVEAMAEAYLEAVAAVAPEGPYRLAGWSFGALVAFEMAQRLARGGGAVELLALLDPAAPGRGGATREAPDEVRSLEFLARDLAALAGVELDLAALGVEAAVRELGAEAALDRVLEATAAAGAVPPELGRREVRRIVAVYRANARAAALYRPEPLDGDPFGDTVAVLAESSEAAAGLGRWRELLPGGLETHTVPADHYSLLRPPRVEVVARLLEETLATPRSASALARRAVPADE